MQNLINKIQSVLEPIMNKMNKMKFLGAISETMQILLPIIITGSFGCLLAFVGIDAWQNILTAAPVLKTIFMNMQSWTMSILSVYIVVALPYLYARKLEMQNEISCSLLSLVAFLTLSMPTPYSAIETTWLGTSGMFSAFIISWGITRLVKVMVDHKITIKMPDSVPPIIANAFATLIPGIVVVTVSAALAQVFAATELGTIHQLIYTVIQEPLRGLGLNYFGLLFVQLIATLAMFCGIHGTSVSTWYIPLVTDASAANLAAYAAGQEIPYIIDRGVFDMTQLGGIGSTLAPAILLVLIAKSKRLKEVGKVAIIPQIFNINEPMLFGMPILLNPMMFIPYVLGQFVSTTGVYLAVATGLIGHSNGAQVSWCIPTYISTALTNTTPVRAVVFLIVLTVIIGIIWFPFIKAMDKQYLADEAGEETAE